MFRDPPHYLKPLSTTTTPKRLLWLACRGYSTRKREHSELHFQAAALGRTWWTVKRHERRDRMDTFDDPEVLWGEVADWCPKGRRVVLFTWDLAEQIRLSHLLTCLPANGWEVCKIVLERTASWCLLRNETRTLLCCDLQSWCPVRWEKIAADLRADGSKYKVVRAGVNMAVDIATTRALMIRDATLQIFDWLEGENLGQFRPTGSGQSFTGFRRRFMRERILVHDDLGRLDAERRAMHTGRAEAWKHGRLRAGPYVEFDLHAAYATIGRDCPVPVRARGELRKPTLDRVQRAISRFAVLAQVRVETDIECVPATVGSRTVWPVGRFTTLLWDPEIELAVQHCSNVRVERAWLYDRAPALRDFCAWVLDHLDGQSQVHGLIPQRVLKHWSRCLVGRFGLRYREWVRFGPQIPPDVRLVTYHDLDDGTVTDMLLAGSTRLLLGDLTESRESLPQIPGWIMSECRARLWQAMKMYSLDRVVYVDTDSIIWSGGVAPFNLHLQDDDLPGTWVRKGVYDRLMIYGPRNLEVGHSRRVSGLPLSARQTAPLEFSGEVMRGVKHAMRAGELDRVVSLPRTFHLEPVDLRRAHNPDGTTSPYRLEEAC